MNKKKFYINIIIFALATALSLLCGELILALLGYEPYIKRTVSLFSERINAKSFDEILSKGLAKGIYGDLKPDADLGYTLYSGPHGFVDKKNFYDDWSGYKRILILGDSFAQGYSASQGKGFVSLLSDHYQKQNVIFFNTAIAGYAQNNQLGVLRKYFDVIKPHLVILCFYFNDFLENLTPVDRYAWFFGDSIIISNYEVIINKYDAKIRRLDKNEIFMLYNQAIGIECIPMAHSSFKQFIKYKIFYKSRLGTATWFAMHNIKNMVHNFRYSPEENKVRMLNHDYVYSITRDYMMEIKEYLADRNTPLLVFMIPDIEDQRLELKKSPGYLKATSLLKELSIPYLEVFDVLTFEDYGNRFSNSRDAHWGDSGHFKAYEALRQYIDKFLQNEKDDDSA
ncbi:MAG: hypothetical protein A2Z72_01755 [Omnitrophica bacterium RBG_13_46_9]|nr:MAG: hypothetical protein A2Z72_01755 [Omnitrophica bacterium RBG_13_46_9]